MLEKFYFAHQDLILYYVAVINILTFFIYGIDKWKSKHKKYRISENCLISLAVIGGAFGAYLGMRAFHHKTKKNKFRITVPLFALLYMAFFIWMYVHVKL